ncbi:MAG TPA: MFS transporter [Myxococcales bacterium]|jgi:OPA family glycerol-3-phosphate transporter-like MFS transporter
MSAPVVSASAAPIPAAFADPAFQKRRMQNWMVLGLLYAFFYMTRYNFSALMDNLQMTFGWSNKQLGYFETMLPAVYGLSVFFNGPLSDRIGGKKAFLTGAIGVTLMNLAFGLVVLTVQTPAVIGKAVEAVGHGRGHAAINVLTPAVLSLGLTPDSACVILVCIWGVNAYFQSFGALSIVKVNAQWFHVRERGGFSGIFGVLIRFGLILAFSGAPLLAVNLGLAYAFLLPAIIVGVLFVANLFMMQNAPKDAGFTDMDTGDGSASEGGDGPVKLSFVLKKVFTSRAAWIIAFCSMMLGMVRRTTVDSWWGKYFANNFVPPGMDKSSLWSYQTAAWGIALLGIAGGFAFGYASDRIFKTRRAPVVTIGFVGMACMLAIFGAFDRFVGPNPWVTALCLALLSFFVNGAHGMIGGAASMDFGGKKAAATAAGLFDGMQYVAAAFVGPMMAYLLDNWGWSAWQWAPIPFAVVGFALIVTLWNVTPGKKPAAPPAEAPPPAPAATPQASA